MFNRQELLVIKESVVNELENLLDSSIAYDSPKELASMTADKFDESPELILLYQGILAKTINKIIKINGSKNN